MRGRAWTHGYVEKIDYHRVTGLKYAVRDNNILYLYFNCLVTSTQVGIRTGTTGWAMCVGRIPSAGKVVYGVRKLPGTYTRQKKKAAVVSTTPLNDAMSKWLESHPVSDDEDDEVAFVKETVMKKAGPCPACNRYTGNGPCEYICTRLTERK